MKISCIIPTCNRPIFLEEALCSIINQTLPAHEIIIINNGTDPVILREDQKHKAIVHNIIPFSGVAQARNFGACLATGDYLAFLDDDDLWNEDYLKNITKRLKEKPDEIFISRLDKIVDGKITPHRNLNPNFTLHDLFIHNPGITGSNVVISKKTFFSLRGFDPKLPPSEDKSLIIEALQKNIPIHILPHNQSILRIHNNYRLTDPARMAEGIFQFIHKYSKLMNRRECLYNWKKMYRYRYKTGKKIAAIPYFTISLSLVILNLFSKT